MIRFASTFFSVGGLLVAVHAKGSAASPDPDSTREAAMWAPAEPLLPGDLYFTIRNAASLLTDDERLDSRWMPSWGDICARPNRAPAICRDRIAPRPIRVSLGLGAYPSFLTGPVGGPFEDFGSGWASEIVDPEIGREHADLPPVIGVSLLYPVFVRAILAFRIGLKRDLSAWHSEPAGMNLPYSDKEIDLNEPSLGYFHAGDEHFAFTVGRFPVHWSPSPEFGLALSRSVPYHNGAEIALKLPRLRYRFLASSLNPWLEGTPVGDSSGQDYPPGSEEYRQRHYPSANGAALFHKRVYSERIKTLFAHRVEGDVGPLSLGVTETQVIGGKTPDFRDAGPFVFFHNDFKEGFANGALSLDASLRLPKGFALLGEYYIDDASYSETEGEGATPSLGGWMLGLRHAFAARGWLFGQSLHAIRTDPYLYGYLQPLNTAASRIVLASNNQRPGDSLFVDKYVIDYPLGYFRGGDAFDFWYRLDAWKGTRYRVSFAAGLLAKGEVDLHTPYETYYSASHDAPSGTAERELRLRLEGEWTPGGGLTLRAGAGWRRHMNAGYRKGDDRSEARAMCGLSWVFPH